MNSKQFTTVNSNTKTVNHFKNIGMYILKNRTITLFFLILIISVVASMMYKTFPTTANFRAIILNMSIDTIVAIGMMILLISGVFDLSVGSVIALSGAVAARLVYYHGVNTWVAIAIALLISLAIGLFNGVMIAKVGVNPMIVGISMMGIIRGIAMLVAGSGIANLPKEFIKIADIEFLGLRIPVWYMLILVLIFYLLVTKTKFFKRYFYIGGNEKAAMLSGINVAKMRIISFMISSGLAGLAGIILTSRLGAAVSSTGQSMEMRTITACILGGASLAGGQGGIVGAALGTLFMGLINNLMVISKVSTNWQSIVIGAILMLAITLDVFITKRTRVKN